MQPTPRRLTLQIVLATLTRLVINTARRFAYPFAPALSVGLGVPLTAITSAIALNQATGLLSPFFGPLTDRWGYRVMMLAGVMVLFTGMVSISLFPLYTVFLFAMFCGGLGKSIYDPALQAYIGEKVPYERRGLVIGLTEFSWSGGTLLGIPLIGYLIVNAPWGWQTPFFIFAALALLALIALSFAISPQHSPPQAAHHRLELKQAWRILMASPVALSLLAFGIWVNIANDMIFVTYGLWLKQSFGLNTATIGFATIFIGLAEISGDTFTATFADRLGLHRTIAVGTAILTMFCILLPFLGQTLILALVALFLVFITFELTVVTSFSFATEILPQARATMMSAYLATSSLGHMIGTLLGGVIWTWGDTLQWSNIYLIAFSAAALNLLAFGSIMWGLRLRLHNPTN